MSITVDIQYAYRDKCTPDRKTIKKWIKVILIEFRDNAEVTIRIVDENESKSLNSKWRKVNGPTNVLSFPAEVINSVDTSFLGDVIICAPVVIREAMEQNKTAEAHWAHMIIHGILHLLGYDHINGHDAEVMESLEVKFLEKLGYGNPYI